MLTPLKRLMTLRLTKHPTLSVSSVKSQGTLNFMSSEQSEIAASYASSQQYIILKQIISSLKLIKSSDAFRFMIVNKSTA